MRKIKPYVAETVRKSCACDGCPNLIPLNWRHCKDRKCQDGTYRRRNVGYDNSIIDQIVRHRDQTEELDRLLREQQTEMNDPYSSKYRHYGRHLAAGASYSLDAPTSRGGPEGLTLHRVTPRKPRGTQTEWWDPTADAAIANLKIKAWVMTQYREQVDRHEHRPRRRQEYEWADPKTGFNSWEAA